MYKECYQLDEKINSTHIHLMQNVSGRMKNKNVLTTEVSLEKELGVRSRKRTARCFLIFLNSAPSVHVLNFKIIIVLIYFVIRQNSHHKT